MTTRNVSEMPDAEKQVLEVLLGQPLKKDQQVFVIAYTPGVVPDEETREAARQIFQQTFEAIDQHAEKQGIDSSEADATVDEALEQIRPRAS